MVICLELAKDGSLSVEDVLEDKLNLKLYLINYRLDFQSFPEYSSILKKDYSIKKPAPYPLFLLLLFLENLFLPLRVLLLYRLPLFLTLLFLYLQCIP